VVDCERYAPLTSNNIRRNFQAGIDSGAWTARAINYFNFLRGFCPGLS